MFSNCLRSNGRTGIIASEEEDVPVAVEESYSGNYIVVFDPLDGSANIDAAVSTGPIFGIYASDQECLTNLGGDPSVSPFPSVFLEPICRQPLLRLQFSACPSRSSRMVSMDINFSNKRCQSFVFV